MKNNKHVEKQPRYFIYSLSKGLSMLTFFSKQNAPLGLTAIAKLNNMNLPTASRYLRTLSDLGYLVLNPTTQKYMLTNKVMALGLGFLNNMDLRTRIQPHMVILSQEFKVSAQCAILDETEIVFVERTRGTGLLDFNLTAGSRLPVYCTALGRAILAYLKPEHAMEIIDKIEFKRRTSYTVGNKQDLLKELDETRMRGYAQNLQEISIGYANYAAPIFNNGEVEGAIGVSFSLEQMRARGLINSMIQKVLNTAKEVSIGI